MIYVVILYFFFVEVRCIKYEYNGKPIRVVVEYMHNIVPLLAGFTDREFFFDTEKCVASWKVGTKFVKDYFGELLAPRMPTAAPLSYGHLVSLGAPLNLYEEGEPNVRPFASDLDEAIAIMKSKKGIDFGDNDLCRHYLRTNRRMQEEFPEYGIPPLAGYSRQGVITSAVLIRGQDFLMDLYDEPEKAQEFLFLLDDSITAFDYWTAEVNGWDPVSPYGAYVYDDFAALVPPYMWSEFVIPHWNRFYETHTTGTYRFVHCEDMHPAHLKYLKEAKITEYQPSVSDLITIEDIKANLDISFDWLLYSWKVANMTDEEIQNWVDTSLAAGADNLRTQFDAYTWKNGSMDRILAYFKAFDKYRVE